MNLGHDVLRNGAMSEHKIEMTAPVLCPKCKTGYLLAFAIAHFERKGIYEHSMEEHPPFSHYEVAYYCSQHLRFVNGGECDYERRL